MGHLVLTTGYLMNGYMASEAFQSSGKVSRGCFTTAVNMFSSLPCLAPLTQELAVPPSDGYFYIYFLCIRQGNKSSWTKDTADMIVMRTLCVILGITWHSVLIAQGQRSIISMTSVADEDLCQENCSLLQASRRPHDKSM